MCRTWFDFTTIYSFFFFVSHWLEVNGRKKCANCANLAERKRKRKIGLRWVLDCGIWAKKVPREETGKMRRDRIGWRSIFSLLNLMIDFEWMSLDSLMSNSNYNGNKSFIPSSSGLLLHLICHAIFGFFTTIPPLSSIVFFSHQSDHIYETVAFFLVVFVYGCCDKRSCCPFFGQIVPIQGNKLVPTNRSFRPQNLLLSSLQFKLFFSKFWIPVLAYNKTKMIWMIDQQYMIQGLIDNVAIFFRFLLTFPASHGNRKERKRREGWK